MILKYTIKSKIGEKKPNENVASEECVNDILPRNF